MLNIDGSFGEGGGQLVRNAVALSAISGEPVTITRIRASRHQKGLAAQHIAAIKAVACACDAECRGISPGSGTIVFCPQHLKCREVSVTVGTAGSIPLVIQAWLSVALCAGGILHITGGTEVSRSPTIDYLDHVLGSVLRSSGAEIDLNILKRGYFPEGGGEVTVRVDKRKCYPSSLMMTKTIPAAFFPVHPTFPIMSRNVRHPLLMPACLYGLKSPAQSAWTAAPGQVPEVPVRSVREQRGGLHSVNGVFLLKRSAGAPQTPCSLRSKIRAPWIFTCRISCSFPLHCLGARFPPAR